MVDLTNPVRALVRQTDDPSPLRGRVKTFASTSSSTDSEPDPVTALTIPDPCLFREISMGGAGLRIQPDRFSRFNTSRLDCTEVTLRPNLSATSLAVPSRMIASSSGVHGLFSGGAIPSALRFLRTD